MTLQKTDRCAGVTALSCMIALMFSGSATALYPPPSVSCRVHVGIVINELMFLVCELCRARLENQGAAANVEATESQPAKKKGKRKR